MGITKGGVQYCFGTKDALIDAIFERWGKAYDSLFEAVAGKQPTPLTWVRAHAEATQRSDELSSSKAAALMAALIQTPEHRRAATSGIAAGWKAWTCPHPRGAVRAWRSWRWRAPSCCATSA